MQYVCLEKKVGETPRMVVETWRERHPEYAKTPLSYAGRLDPMASGKLLVLIGDECKKQSAYTGLDKEYIIEVLFGVGSDTGDVLGFPTTGVAQEQTEKEIQDALSKQVGSHERAYPVFSSKTVSGKPLFLYALEGTLGSIEIPTHQETIYGAQLSGLTILTAKEVENRVFSSLSLAPRSDEPSKVLGADFRQDDIKEAWGTFFSEYAGSEFSVATIVVTCGSGTYMRSLAGRLGETLGTRALALSIHRSKIGMFDVATHAWKKEF